MASMRSAKRACDACGALLGVAVMLPLFLVIAGAIVLDDGWPVLFRQERVGAGGRRFRIWKFRTMVVDAGRRGRAEGAQLTVAGDPRITRVGRWLRRLKLDELPQLVNVLRGEMSFVGPRPEVPRYVALYTPAQREVLRLVPGITDPASIAYRDESELLAAVPDPERAYVEELMPEKIRINLEYAARATVASDLAVIAETLWRVGARRGAGEGRMRERTARGERARPWAPRGVDGR